MEQNTQFEKIDFEGMNLPIAPEIIEGEIVDLLFDKIQPGDARYGFVPYYYFIVNLHKHHKVGHISFKIGRTSHVLFCAGHVGYGIDIPFRGHSYAFHACKTLIPFLKTIYDSVILTADPDNIPSIKTIEKLGATYLDLHPIPKEDPNYAKGIRQRQRYEWKP
jgi:predicted acetyltransferase